MPRIIDNLVHFNGKGDEVSYNKIFFRDLCVYNYNLIHICRVRQQVVG